MAYKSFDNFLESITQRGLGAAEMLAMEMKSAGLYVSRGLSFKQAEVDVTILTAATSHMIIYTSHMIIYTSHMMSHMTHMISHMSHMIICMSHMISHNPYGQSQEQLHVPLQFTMLEVPLSDEQVQVYSTAAHVW